MAPRRAIEARKEADLDFERLYAGHRGDVFRAALRELGNVHDAEDVTQAAFIDAYRAVLRGSRPEAPRAWLLAIAENVRRRRFRTALRRPREEPLDPEAALAAEPTTDQTNALRGALAGLPPQQRAVFLLREIVGLSYDEIAEELGSTVGAVQMLLFRARQALRAELEPPAVTQRSGIIVPLPGWLTGLAARSDALVLTPRAAGTLGAAVLAVTGITAGVATSPTDAASPRVVQRSGPATQQRQPQTQAAAVVVARTLAVPTRPARRQAALAPKPQRTPLGAAPAAPEPAAPAASTPEAPAHGTEVRQAPAVASPAHQLPAVTVVEEALPSLPAPPTVSAELPPPPAPLPPPPAPLPPPPAPLPPLPTPPVPPLPPLP